MKEDLNHARELSRQLNQAGTEGLADIIRYYCENSTHEEHSALTSGANLLREEYYGRRVYLRGLIEFSSYCRNDCYYCGLRRSNIHAHRYRLSQEEILSCCESGYISGFRTFVLQSGEDMYYTDVRLSSIVHEIKARFPDCAVTLSVGERSSSSYKLLFDAGADRYLLRHETANQAHYNTLHPSGLSLQNRRQCLYDLKKIGYQIGAGFMVESPFQNFRTLAEDLAFIRELQPHMIGVGPFIPHKDTKFARFRTPSSSRTLIMLSLIRVMMPKVLLPATTALSTVDSLGREKGLKAGANVVMPNLTPAAYRRDYALYDNKPYTGEEALEGLERLTDRIISAGFIPDFSRGDHVDIQNGGDRFYADRTRPAGRNED